MLHLFRYVNPIRIFSPNGHKNLCEIVEAMFDVTKGFDIAQKIWLLTNEPSIREDGAYMHDIAFPRPAFRIQVERISSMSIQEYCYCVIEIYLVRLKISNMVLPFSAIILHSPKTLLATRDDAEGCDF